MASDLSGIESVDSDFLNLPGDGTARIGISVSIRDGAGHIGDLAYDHIFYSSKIVTNNTLHLLPTSTVYMKEPRIVAMLGSPSVPLNFSAGGWGVDLLRSDLTEIDHLTLDNADPRTGMPNFGPDASATIRRVNRAGYRVRINNVLYNFVYATGDGGSAGNYDNQSSWANMRKTYGPRTWPGWPIGHGDVVAGQPGGGSCPPIDANADVPADNCPDTSVRNDQRDAVSSRSLSGGQYTGGEVRNNFWETGRLSYISECIFNFNSWSASIAIWNYTSRYRKVNNDDFFNLRLALY